MDWLKRMSIVVGVFIFITALQAVVMGIELIATLPFEILGWVFRLLMSTELFG